MIQKIKLNTNKIYNIQVYPNLSNNRKKRSAKNLSKRKFPLDRLEFTKTLNSLSNRFNCFDIAELFKEKLSIEFYLKFNIGTIFVIRVNNTQDYWIFNLTKKNIDLFFNTHIQKNIFILNKHSTYIGSYSKLKQDDISCGMLDNIYEFKEI